MSHKQIKETFSILSKLSCVVSQALMWVHIFTLMFNICSANNYTDAFFPSPGQRSKMMFSSLACFFLIFFISLFLRNSIGVWLPAALRPFLQAIQKFTSIKLSFAARLAIRDWLDNVPFQSCFVFHIIMFCFFFLFSPPHTRDIDE